MATTLRRALARAHHVSVGTAVRLRTALGWRPGARHHVSMWSRPDHLTMLAAMLPEDAAALSLLDLGCGDATHTRQLVSARKTYVDIERRPGSPEPFVEGDAIGYLRDHPDGHDMIFCLDTIEH